MSITIKYKDIVKKGVGNNEYYEQSPAERQKLVDHLNEIVYLNIYRTEDFQDIKDWKKFNEEMIEPVAWAHSTKHNWKPSVRDMLAQCVATGANNYNGSSARFSKRQIENFNRCCSIIAKIWNTYCSQKITASELQVKMELQDEAQDPLAHLKKFIEPTSKDHSNGQAKV